MIILKWSRIKTHRLVDAYPDFQSVMRTHPLGRVVIKCFPGLATIASNESTDGYQQVAIAVYDHWLSEEEAYKELNDVPIEKQKINDAKLHSFVCRLTSSFESYLVKRVGNRRRPSAIHNGSSARWSTVAAIIQHRIE